MIAIDSGRIDAQSRVETETVNDMLSSYYIDYSERLSCDAENILLYLHDNLNRHAREVEAIIVTLCAQSRSHEAAIFMTAGVKHMLSKRILLLKARFCLDLFITQDFPLEVLKRCLLAAVTDDNVNLMKELKRKNVQLKNEIESYNIAISVARCENQRMLKFLHDESIDVLSLSHSRLLLRIFAELNRADVVRFLLSVSTRSADAKAAYEIALRYEHIEILHVFTKYSRSIAGTYIRTDDLQIECAIYSDNAPKCVEYLIHETDADVNAVDKDDRAAVHIVAEKDLMNVLCVLQRLEANMMTIGLVQQTSMEIAYCNEYSMNAGCFESTPEFAQRKLELARSLIIKEENEYRMAIFKLAGFSPVDERLASLVSLYDKKEIRDKLAEIWFRHIELETIQELNNMFDTSTYQALEKLRKLSLEINQDDNTLRSTETEHSVADIVKKLHDDFASIGPLQTLIHDEIRFLTSKEVELLAAHVASPVGRVYCIGRQKLVKAIVLLVMNFKKVEIGQSCLCLQFDAILTYLDDQQNDY